MDKARNKTISILLSDNLPIEKARDVLINSLKEWAIRTFGEKRANQTKIVVWKHFVFPNKFGFKGGWAVSAKARVPGMNEVS